MKQKRKKQSSSNIIELLSLTVPKTSETQSFQCPGPMFFPLVSSIMNCTPVMCNLKIPDEPPMFFFEQYLVEIT